MGQKHDRGPHANGNSTFSATQANRRAAGTGYKQQVVGITDIISEGPIKGLVNGGKSVFVNNDPLLSDDATAYAPNGQVATGTGGSTTITVEGAEANNFNYDPSTNTGNRFKRKIALFDAYVITKADNNLTFNTGVVPNPQDTSMPGGQVRVLDFTFSATGLNALNIPDSVQSTRLITLKDIDFSDLERMKEGDGIVVVTNSKLDRYALGKVKPSSITDTSIVIRIPRFGVTEDTLDWIKEQEVKIGIALVKQVESVDTVTDTITLTTALPTGLDYTGNFSLSNTFNNGTGTSQSNKIQSAGYQFRNGLVDQPAIQNLGGTGISSIPLNPHPELQVAESKTITADGQNAAEIDQIDLVFQYPGGLYMVNSDDGGKWNAGAGYVIEIQVGDENGVYSVPTPNGAGDTKHFLTGNAFISDLLFEDLSGFSSKNNALVQLGIEAGTPIFAHGGKNTSAVAFTHSIDLTPYQPFNRFKLKVTRITESANLTDGTDGRAHVWNDRIDGDSLPQLTYRGRYDGGQSDTKWQAVQSGGISQVFGVIREKLTYPYTALCYVTFDSKAYTDTPSRSYECYGLKVRVPKNYTPRESFGLLKASDAPFADSEAVGGLPAANRLYSGIFTGELTDTPVYTDNPAWVFFDIVTSNRYGVGEFVRDSDLDIFALYKIAKFCDELVPDGKGGFEPRFRANIYLTTATDVYKVLKDMATIFRGLLYWMDSKLTPVVDQKSTPIYTFNKTNVINGEFTTSFTGSKNRINQVVVSWNNPANNFELEPLFVEDRSNIAKTGKVIRDDAVAFGCTSRGQAIRYGRWKLYTSINQTEVITFKSALNSVFLAPGDVVNIQDNSDYDLAYGGRIKEIQGTGPTFTIEFDRPIGEGLATLGTTSKIVLLLSEAKVLATDSCVLNGVQKSSGDPVTIWKTGDGKKVVLVPNNTSINSIFAPQTGDYGFALDTQTSYIRFSNGWGQTNPQLTLDQLVGDAFDDAGKPIQLKNARENRTVEIPYTGAVGDTSFTTSALTLTEVQAANHAKIWALKDSTQSAASYQEYRILSIAEEEENIFTFTAMKHFDEKFDAVESNFVTERPSSTFPLEEENSIVPPPLDLRVHRAPKFERDGEEITLYWEAPSTTQDRVIVDSFQLIHDIPGHESIIETNRKNYYFSEVPSGRYNFEVRSISREGRLSAPAILSADILDFYGGGHPRQYGMIKGGSVSAPSVVVNTTAQKLFKFETNPIFFFSPAALDSNSKSLTFDSLDYTALAKPSSATWFDDVKNLTKSNAFVFLHKYDTAPNIRLINFIRDPVLNIQYWYDQLLQNKKAFNENTEDTSLHYPDNPDIWSQKGGTVTILEKTSKVVGTNTNFLSDYTLTSIIKFSDGQAANVTYVQDDTTMYIDRQFRYKKGSISTATRDGTNVTYTTTEDHGLVVGDFIQISGLQPGSYNTSTKVKVVEVVSSTQFKLANTTSQTLSQGGGTFTNEITGSAHFCDELGPDFRKDFLIGNLNFSGNFRSFLTIDPDIVSARSAIIDSNIAFINYDGAEPEPQQSTTFSSGIVLDINPIGYLEPEVKVSGAGFSQTAASFTADNDFVAATDNRRVVQVHDNTTIAYGTGASAGSSLDFTIDVRDGRDRDNVAKQVQKTFSIVKVRDGAEGTQGRTVELVAEDNSVLYAAGGTNPSFNSTTGNASTITLTATARNFGANPLFRFKVGSGAMGSFSTTNTVEVTPPSTRGNSSGTTVLVEVAQAGTTEVLASDSTSIVFVESGADGADAVVVVNPNDSHAYTTPSDGSITGNIPNSGTTLEVLIGGTVGTYIGRTSGAQSGYPGTATVAAFDAAMADGQWYISAVNDTDANLNAGTIASVSNNIVTINPATVSGTIEDTEVITWTIKAKNAGSVVEIPTTQSLSKSKAGENAGAVVEVFATTDSTSAPSNPAGNFDFSTRTFTFSSGDSDWSLSQTSVSASAKFAYKLTKALDFSTSTVSIGASDWTGPVLVAKFGDSGVDGMTARLTPQSGTKFVTTYDDAGNLDPSSQNFAFTVTANGIRASSASGKRVYIKVFVDGTEDTNLRFPSSAFSSGFNKTDSAPLTYNFDGASEIGLPASGTAKEISVEVHEAPSNATLGTNTIVARDSITVYGVQQGSDSLTAFLTNPTAFVAANANGSIGTVNTNASQTINPAKSGIFKVFKGSTLLTGSTTPSVSFSKVSASGVPAASDATINATTGEYSVSKINRTDDAAALTMKATLSTGTELVSTFEVTKSKQGEAGTGLPGSAGPKTQTGYLYFHQALSTAPTGSDALTSGAITVDFDDARNTKSTNPPYSVSPPDFNAGDGTKHFYYYYSAIQTDTNGDGTFNGVDIDIVGPLAGVGFSGLVTFTGDESDSVTLNELGGSGSLSLGPNGTTQINGAVIKTGSITADSIAANQLTLGGTGGGAVNDSRVTALEDIEVTLPDGQTKKLIEIGNDLVLAATGSGDNTNSALAAGTFITKGRITLLQAGLLISDDDGTASTGDSTMGGLATSAGVVQLNNAIDINATGTDNSIKIFDGDTLRVTLGKLT